MNMPESLRKSAAWVDVIPGGVLGISPVDNNLLFASDSFFPLLGYTREDFSALREYGGYASMVHPEDRPLAEAAVRQALQQGGKAQLAFRLVKKSGEPLWVRMYAGLMKDEELGDFCLCVFSDDTDTVVASRQVRITQQDMDTLINTIPGGVARVTPDGDFRIISASEGFYKMTGYTEAEAKKAPVFGCARNLILPEDIAAVADAVGRLLEDNEPICVSYRIRRKDGSIANNTAYCKYLFRQEGVLVVDGVFIDVTETHRIQRELEINEERYRIVCEQTQDIVFDWDLETDLLYHSPVFEKKFGYMMPENITAQQLCDADIIFKEDRPILRGIFERLKSGVSCAAAEYRVRNSEGRNIWCRATATVVFDEGRKPRRAVGILQDIDEYKRQTAFFREQAQRDLLTGLYNKMTTHLKVENSLRAASRQGHAVYLLDIDDFKNINDSQGHAFGDTVLQELGAHIQELFRGNDVVGRVGGDEFLVLMENVRSLELVKKKAQALCDAFHDCLQDGVTQRVSGSVGVALYPQDGLSFEELYKSADTARYFAKRSGKNRFAFTKEIAPMLTALPALPVLPAP